MRDLGPVTCDLSPVTLDLWPFTRALWCLVTPVTCAQCPVTSLGLPGTAWWRHHHTVLLAAPRPVLNHRSFPNGFLIYHSIIHSRHHSIIRSHRPGEASWASRKTILSVGNLYKEENMACGQRKWVDDLGTHFLFFSLFLMGRRPPSHNIL